MNNKVMKVIVCKNRTWLQKVMGKKPVVVKEFKDHEEANKWIIAQAAPHDFFSFSIWEETIDVALQMHVEFTKETRASKLYKKITRGQ